MGKTIMYNGKPVTTIDATPTWEGLLPIYLEAIRYGKTEAQQAAMSELTRMAQSADRYNTLKKTAK